MTGPSSPPAPGAVLLTVLTPTYDRAHTLHRLYESLLAQDCRDVEWLIVDDGSTDATAELVAGWRSEGRIAIRYLQQANGGKGSAVNAGVRVAAGELIAIYDSDDACSEDAVAIVRDTWRALDPAARRRIAGLVFTCVDEKGRPTSPPFPRDGMTCSTIAMRYEHDAGGEWQEVTRADVLRRYPFPVVAGSRAPIPESVTWSRIARDWDCRFVNRVVRVYYRHDGVARISTPGKATRNAIGKFLWMQARLNLEMPWFRHAPGLFWRTALEMVRAGLHAGEPLGRQFVSLHGVAARLLWVVAVPFGCARWLRDRSGRS